MRLKDSKSIDLISEVCNINVIFVNLYEIAFAKFLILFISYLFLFSPLYIMEKIKIKTLTL